MLQVGVDVAVGRRWGGKVGVGHGDRRDGWLAIPAAGNGWMDGFRVLAPCIFGVEETVGRISSATTP